MAITPIKPATSNTSSHIFLRRFDHLGLTYTSGLGGSAPVGQAVMTKWSPTEYDATANPGGGTVGTSYSNNPITGGGVTPASIGARGWACNTVIPANTGIANGISIDFANGWGGSPPWAGAPYYNNCTHIVSMRNPLGMENDQTQLGYTLGTGGSPGIFSLSQELSGGSYHITVGLNPGRQLGLWVRSSGGSTEYDGYGSLAVRVGPEVFALESNGTEVVVSLLRNGAMNRCATTSAASTAGGATMRGWSSGIGSGKGASRTIYDAIAQYGNGSISASSVLSYCQWMLNHANGGSTFLDPTKAVVFLGDSMLYWGAKHGLSFPSVFEQRVRSSGVAVYSQSCPGIRAAQLYNSNSITKFKQLCPDTAFTIDNNGLAYSKLVFVLCLGTNDIWDSTAAATIANYINTIAGWAKSAHGASKVLAWVPPTNALFSTAKEDIRRAMSAALTGLSNLDGIIDIGSMCPELVAEESTDHAIRYAGSSMGFQSSASSGVPLDGTLNNGVTGLTIGIDPPHFGPFGHAMVGDAMANHSGLLNALGISVGASGGAGGGKIGIGI